MPKYKVEGDEKVKEVDAPTIEDAAKTVKEQVSEEKVLEVVESENKIIVKEVING